MPWRTPPPILTSMIDPHLPLVDLHRHLDGSIRLQTILDLAHQHRLSLPFTTLEELRPQVQITESQPGVMAFLAKFRWMIYALADYDACRRVAYENVEDAHLEGVDYVELRFSPMFMAEAHGLHLEGVVDAVIEGVRAGEQDFGVTANLIGIISRTYGPERGWQELNAMLPRSDEFVGLDLAGDEARFPPRLFVEHFRKAHAAGWQATVHAGESAGPQSIWDALQLLGAQRIGHGVAAQHDPALLNYLAEQRVGVEVNLTSNLQTQTISEYALHPAKAFLERGLLVTLNTDDPGISGIDLRYEYEVAAPAAGFSMEQLRQVQRNGLEAAFLGEDAKQRLRDQKR